MTLEVDPKRIKAIDNALGVEQKALVPRNSKIIETEKRGGTFYPVERKENFIEHKPKKRSFWDKDVERGDVRKAGRWAWGKGKTAKGYGYRGAKSTANFSGRNLYRTRNTLGRLGYAASGFNVASPLAIFSMAWNKTSTAVKTTIMLVFAFALLFLPWGVFYYTGWAVGAAFMFLISLIYWALISFFNGIAFVIVGIINGIVTVILSMLIWIIEMILGLFSGGMKTVTNPDPYGTASTIRVPGNYWYEGHALMHNSMIRYDQIANIPSLMIISEPGWKGWMNDTLIGHVMGLLGIEIDFSWISEPFRQLYSTMSTGALVAVSLIVVAIPIVFLVYVYMKNRHYM